MSQTVVLRSQPGVKRDGTKFDGDFYTDAQWCRFQRGLPRKIGGYRSISKFLSELSRGFSTFSQNLLQYCHSGGASTVERFTIDATRNSSIIIDRTPTTLVNSDENQWMFDFEYDSSTTSNLLIAHVAPNGASMNNANGGQIFTGDVVGTTALTEVTLPAGANATGGVVALHPYLFYYGSSGIIGWSVAGTPTDLSGAGSGIARVWGQKIVKGMPLRAGAGSAPAGIFWANDAVIRSSFTGGSTVFQFDVLAGDTSIMSPNSVVDYDGTFYWIGVDRFFTFSGVVRDVPNTMNINWFFDGVNHNQRSKVFAFKVPRYGEIWWCYPRGEATECTHAIIYNVRENCWYDTALPSSGRTAGWTNNDLACPVLTGAEQTPTGYQVWLHEQGLDAISGQSIQPIQSYFETADLSTLVQGQNTGMRITAIEPDFIQSGPLTVQVTGRANARAPEVYSNRFTIPEVASQPYEQIVMLKEQRRELRVKFESNAVGGDYQMGQVIGHMDVGDGTIL
jgi:hypothetical protein